MKTFLTAALLCVLFSGCRTTEPRPVTNPNQPGSQVGNVVGYTAGAVVGNVAGAAVGVVEGAGAAISDSFDSTSRVVRRWKDVQTSDGRTIQVYEDILVDEQGNPIR